MVIERGQEKYYADALQLVRNFYNEALKEYDKTLDEQYLLSNFDKYKSNAFLLIIEDKCEGILAGLSVTTPLNNQKIFEEVIWYVNKPFRKYGVQMLKEAQKALKEEGYTTMVIALMHNSKTEKLAKFYEGQGFKPFETHYLRQL